LEVDGVQVAGAVILTCGDQAPLRVNVFLCGNGQIDGGETCDDGNFTNGDGCSEQCTLECGNGIVEGNEACDDGNLIDTDDCTAACQAAVCGDNIIFAGVEDCDGGEGCLADCSLIGCHAANGCPDLGWVPIAGGAFDMGYGDGLASEQPVHRVNVGDFEIMRAEVTIEQYRLCVDDDACDAPPSGGEYNWGRPGRDEFPANGISWLQAQQFAAWVGARLPTEAEWEFVARNSGAQGQFPWGDDVPNCDQAHNYTCEGPMTHRVCSHPDGNTVHGVCDMIGNAWEWVQDNYHRTYEGAPDNGAAWCNVPDCSHDRQPRVWKGGDYRGSLPRMRATARGYYAADVDFSWMGFRLVR